MSPANAGSSGTRGKIYHSETRTDSAGREQQAHKPKPEPPPLPDVDSMSLEEVQSELRSDAPTMGERRQQLWHCLDALGKSSIPAPQPSVDADHKRAEREAKARRIEYLGGTMVTLGPRD